MPPHSLTASSRSLRLLAAARGAILRRTSGRAWADPLCRALVETGSLHAASVALPADDPSDPHPRVVARASRGADGAVHVGIGTQGAAGPLIAAALASGRTVGAPASAPWPPQVEARALAVSSGQVSIAVPSVLHGRVVGALEVSTAAPAAFDDDDLAALRAVADDLSGILPALTVPAAPDGSGATVTSNVLAGEPSRVLVMGDALLAPGPDGRVALAADTAAALARDLTALATEVRHLRPLAELSPDLLIRVDPEGQCLYANAAFASLAGRPAADAPGQRLDDLLRAAGVSAAAAAQVQAAAVGVARGGQPRPMAVAIGGRDGGTVWEVTLVPERDARGHVTAVLISARDVTARERAAEAARERDARVRQVVEHVDEVFWLRDAASDRLLFMSRAGDTLFGSRERLLQDPAAWLALVHPDDQARVADARASQAIGGYDLEYRLLRDGEIRWVRDRAFPVRGDDGGVPRVAGIVGDVTARRSLEQQLRHAQKMEAIGQLAGGVAHDFNNLLAVVQMQTSLLLAGPADRATLEEGLREVLAATERASNLTRQLLTFSRRHVTQQESLDLAEVIGGMTRLLRRVLGDDVTLETRFAPSLPRVRADRGLVEQVLMNLAVNSRDAMPRGGRLIVALDVVDVDAAQLSAHPAAAPGTFVRLTVTDSGSGIPAELLPHVFEPFFTTKEVGKGTGLGLATVFGILQQHQGWVDVESRPDEGATFRAYLPAQQGAPVPAAGRDDTAPPRGHETILFVEDEPAVRAIVRGALERFGYTVVEAESAVHARDLWPGVRDRVDLLITDVILPGGMSGRDLADHVTADRPGLGVIYITGYGPEFVGVGLTPGRRLLQKPFAASALARVVRQVIDERVRRP